MIVFALFVVLTGASVPEDIPLQFRRCDISETHDITEEAFYSQYFSAAPILVLHPPHVESAQHAWALHSLSEDPAAATTIVQVGRSQEIISNGGAGPHNMALHSFIRHLRESETSKGTQSTEELYVFDRNNFFDITGRDIPAGVLALRPDNEESVLGFDVEEEHSTDRYFFLGANATGVTFHSHSDTRVVLFRGHKLWAMYAPGTLPTPRYAHPGGMARWFNAKYPTLPADRKPLLCLQPPGSVMYVPEGWHHATLNWGITLAVAEQQTVPRDPLLRMQQLATMFLAKGNLKHAEEVTAEMLALSPTSPMALSARGALLMRQAEGEDEPPERKRLFSVARHYLQSCLSLDANDLKALGNLCRVSTASSSNAEHLSLKDVKNAVKTCKQAQRLDPTDTAHAIQAATLLQDYGEPRQAAKILRKSLIVNPQCFMTHAALGACLLQLARPKDAVEVLRSALDVAPHEARGTVLLQLGGALLENGEALEGLRRLEEAVEASPSLLSDSLLEKLVLLRSMLLGLPT